MATPKILIITGNGFNCEREMKAAFTMCGGSADIVHMNDILTRETKLTNYQILGFIGGFSFADHLGGGKVTAIKFLNHLKDDLRAFIENDTLSMGICNGFQVIVQLGLLPGLDGSYFLHNLTLAPNRSNRYEDRWVHLKSNSESPCVFTKGIDKMFIPARHGEGQICTMDDGIMSRIKNENLIALQYIHPENGEPTEEYPFNPNGSIDGIAGVCDPTGRIFGIMPHPEAYLNPYNHPHWTRLKVEDNLPKEGDGLQIFRNAVNYFN